MTEREFSIARLTFDSFVRTTGGDVHGGLRAAIVQFESLSGNAMRAEQCQLTFPQRGKRYSADKIALIKREILSGRTYESIRAMFGCSMTTISRFKKEIREGKCS